MQRRLNGYLGTLRRSAQSSSRSDIHVDPLDWGIGGVRDRAYCSGTDSVGRRHPIIFSGDATWQLAPIERGDRGIATVFGGGPRLTRGLGWNRPKQLMWRTRLV